jgi:hypothetical protein
MALKQSLLEERIQHHCGVAASSRRRMPSISCGNGDAATNGFAEPHAEIGSTEASHGSLPHARVAGNY